jgi:hypothetical protein
MFNFDCKDVKVFRAGDHVHHSPSTENWVLACDEVRGEVVCAGWPETTAKATDCTLLKAATDEQRAEMLLSCSHHDGLRGSRARAQLATLPNALQLLKETLSDS